MDNEEIYGINRELDSADPGALLVAMDRLESALRQRLGDASSLGPLARLLHHENAEVRKKAIWLIGKLAQNKVPGEYPVSYVLGLMEDEDEESRENAAWAVGEMAALQIGGEQEAEKLNSLLKDDSSQVRGMAAWALGRLAERASVALRSSESLLRQLLQDKSVYVCKSASWALERLEPLLAKR